MSKKEIKLNKVVVEEEKLTWEIPTLICLDKRKTESGTSWKAPTEDYNYTSPTGS